jgi:hypothetical protein
MNSFFFACDEQDNPHIDATREVIKPLNSLPSFFF